MNPSIDAAYEAYRKAVGEHDCPEDDTCTHPKAFYLIGFVNGEGNVDTYSGGHKNSPAMAAEALVRVVDQYMIDVSGLDELHAFMKSRDLIHSAANMTDPPPGASMAMNQFVDDLEKGDE